MRKNHVITGLATVVAASIATTVAVPAAGASEAAPQRAGTTSLAEVLAADGHGYDQYWADFDILDKAVSTVLAEKPNSSVAVLAQGKTRLTAFLPTDRAFRKLVGGLSDSHPKTEKATFTAVAGLVDIDTLETVLLHHVVPGATVASPKVLKADGAELTTAQGGTVTVKIDGKNVTLVDSDPDATDATANPKQLDINKGNRQIAHGVDRVLRPVNL